jgi:outer membrane protein assembly factor BamA
MALYLFRMTELSAQTTGPLPLSVDWKGLPAGISVERLRKDYLPERTATDSLQALVILQRGINRLHADGYLCAGLDKLSRNAAGFKAELYVGSAYTWVRLKTGNTEENFLRGTGYRNRWLEDQRLSSEKTERILENILKNCEHTGYPFASVRLDSLSLTGDQLEASLRLEKGPFIRIDSIRIQGSAKIAPVYIHNYIGIRPGDLYDERLVRRVSNRMKELPFVTEARGSQVVFAEKVTRLDLYLNEKKASQFDAVVGFLPDDQRPGKLNLTGEAHLRLQNSFRRGEILELNWKQLPPRSQDLKLRFQYPFLFNTALGIDGNLNLFRRDTLFTDVIKNLGVFYSFTGNNFIKAFVNDKQSNLQSTAGLENITVLPAYADIQTLSYGLTGRYERLDYRLNPRTGFAAEASVSTGNRIIRKNADINPLVYDSLSLRSVQYAGELRFDAYLPISGRLVLNLGGIGAYQFNPEAFTNELFRIGGLRSLRGFDEESIFASAYAIGKTEVRYLLEQNSFLFVFGNTAWYERRRKLDYRNDWPIGFGTGINFETRLGILSVSYALGRQAESPIQLRNGKVHFGIVNYF